MYKLLQGVDEFRRQSYPQRKRLFGELSKGQSPIALFITCSDSGIVPNLLTHTEPGDLFVLRNAGNLVAGFEEGRSEAATIEYAVKVLQVKDIIVCGHSHCGAMAALFDPGSCEGLPAMSAWINDAQPMVERVRQRHHDVSPEDLLNLVIKENVILQLATLREHPAVREALESEQLNLHGWVCSIASGEVVVFDPLQRAFLPVYGPPITSP